MREKNLSVRIQKNSAPNRISALSTANFNILHFYLENDFKLISSGRKKKKEIIANQIECWIKMTIQNLLYFIHVFTKQFARHAFGFGIGHGLVPGLGHGLVFV